LLNFAPVISNIYFDSKKEPYQATLFSKNIKLPMLPASAVFLFPTQIYPIFVKNKKKTMGSVSFQKLTDR
jgi:ATP-dependent Lon protease